MLRPETLELIISDTMWLVIVVGWIFLFATGLEADKPLSGGIPGHVEPHEELQLREGWWGRLGESAAWLIFSAIALTLPLALWWIFVVHQ